MDKHPRGFADMIEIKITIPHEEASNGPAALAARMAVLGYTQHTPTVQAWTYNGPAVTPIYDGPEKNTLTDSDLEATAEPAKVEPAKRTRKTKADDKPQISTTPENRVEPEAVVDDEETAALDAADEAAEVEATRDPVKVLTVDDVKQAIGLYVAKFAMAATQEDGPAILVSALGAPPAGEDKWKLSLLASVDQQALAKTVQAWEAAAAAEKRFGA
jgi:hypothetical protein